MATQIKISELPLASEDALSLASDDRFIFNNDNVNTQTIKFANLVDAITEQNLTFKGVCTFNQGITGPNGGDIGNSIDSLIDVEVANPQSGQILQYSGAEWVNVNISAAAINLTDLSVETSDTPAAAGALAYDNTSGVFTYSPVDTSLLASTAELAAKASVTDFSVTTAAASGSGALTYNNAGVFTFTPAAVLTLADFSVSVSAASGQGNLVYDNGTGAFTFTPADTYTAAQADAAFAPIGVTVDTALTGTPTAPTAASGTSTTQIATTAFAATAATEAVAAAAGNYATAAQGATADANDTDIDDVYTALVAIGNNGSISDIAGLKAALAALTRS